MVEWLNFLVWAPQATQKERPIDCCHSDHLGWTQINRNNSSTCCISEWVLAEVDQPAITAWSICEQHLRDTGVEESPVAQSAPQPAELPHLPAQLFWEATHTARTPQATPPTLGGHTDSDKPWDPPQTLPDSHHYNLGPDTSARLQPSCHSHSGGTDSKATKSFSRQTADLQNILGENIIYICCQATASHTMTNVISTDFLCVTISNLQAASVVKQTYFSTDVLTQKLLHLHHTGALFQSSTVLFSVIAWNINLRPRKERRGISANTVCHRAALIAPCNQCCATGSSPAITFPSLSR